MSPESATYRKIFGVCRKMCSSAFIVLLFYLLREERILSGVNRGETFCREKGGISGKQRFNEAV